MKRLLLLSFLCLVPSAHAVDYVKCEAMVRAFNAAKIHPDLDEVDYALRGMYCDELGVGPRGETEWMDCYHSDNASLASEKGQDKLLRKHARKMTKIHIEMAQEDCPQLD